MTRPDQLVADVLRAADAPIVGRIRLQKMIYLLDQKGMGSGLSFHYHHYGPYSRELDAAIERAQAVQGVTEEIAHRQIDGMPYSIFSLRTGQPRCLSTVGNLASGDARRLIAFMKERSSTVLELAATIHWLATFEKVSDWRKELVRRKGRKTERGRLEEAGQLLERMGLSPT